MAKELETLRQQREETRVTASPSTNNETASGTYGSPQETSDHPSTATVSDFGIKDEYQLDDFVIDKGTVIELFKIFSLLFYPHWPIIHPHISISSMHSSAPVLFWTVIAITLSRAVIPEHADVFNQLLDPYQEYLRRAVLKAPVPYQTIQALTYLIVWPFPAERQNRDSTWLYCGVATNAAMYMGLHHARPPPSLRSIGVPAGTPKSRAHTWLGCFVASTCLGMHIGVPPIITGTKELETIESLVRSHSIHPEFGHQVMVHATLARYTRVVTDTSEEVVSQSLIRLFDAELDGIRNRFPNTPWNARVEMASLIAKIHVYTMAVIRIYRDMTTREILMRRAYATALRIIYLCDQGGLALHPVEYKHLDTDFLERAVPKNYFRALFLATIFLLRFFALNIHAAPEEQEAARNHVAMAQRYLKAGSLNKNDEKERAAFLLEVLSRQQPIDVDNDKLRIDDRMGASLVYDAITTGHKLRNLGPDFPEEHDEAEVETGPAAAAVPEEAALPPPIPGQDGLAAAPVDVFAQMPPPPPLMPAAQGMAQVDINGMDPFAGALEFALPEDLWGDSIWNMFNSGASDHPMMYQ
ncbi:hypothetical protein DM02DRAFT_51421 [Periconia macrospinosa]|uniref:Xylanolytic transcriptional activator regulatory domain-containing protein n=1 Tax=Periconia macrospinosa TaxID=97972 RepID=A0A2V1DLW5_9PLEO|nr:hypothetical protein DM02DRAFT_51421 [Periconia macrospinosa]